MRASALPSLPAPRSLPLLLAALLWLVATGCASTPEVGVRPTFADARVTQVAVLPFYSTSRFSKPPEQHAEILELYQTTAEQWLVEQGFDVVGAEALRAHLEANEALQTLEDGIALRGPLDHYFEPQEDGPVGMEVETLRGLHAAGKLPTDVVLLGEVVYQTDTACRVPTSEYTDYARVITQPDGEPSSTGTPEAAGSGEVGCVVSHFQAKLVDARTGRTMWHNRFLRELRDPPITEEKRIANIAETVATTLGGDHGMRRFLASPSGQAQLQ